MNICRILLGCNACMLPVSRLSSNSYELFGFCVLLSKTCSTLDAPWQFNANSIVQFFMPFIVGIKNNNL